jgi:hypothetical protein
MKKTKITLILAGVIVLSGCGQLPAGQNPPVEKKEAIKQAEEKIPGVVPAAKEGPKEVAASYANLTLMTFPADAQAKKYLAPELQAKFDAPGFVPQSYGIQDTPSSITVGEAVASGNTATVKVTGQFGQTQEAWEFTLGNFNDEWKISKISRTSK